MTQVKTIGLPVDVVLALFDFAGRGRLDRDEWRFLERWEATFRQGIAQASQPKEPADVEAKPPFDPNTEEAEKKRQRRRERRKAEATKQAMRESGGSAVGGASEDDESAGETDAP